MVAADRQNTPDESQEDPLERLFHDSLPEVLPVDRLIALHPEVSVHNYQVRSLRSPESYFEHEALNGIDAWFRGYVSGGGWQDV